jgi:hypothetical protein
MVKQLVHVNVCRYIQGFPYASACIAYPQPSDIPLGNPPGKRL